MRMWCGRGGGDFDCRMRVGDYARVMSTENEKPKSQLEALRELQAKASPIDQGSTPEERVEQFRRNTEHLVEANRRSEGTDRAD